MKRRHFVLLSTVCLIPLSAKAQISFGGCFDAANRPVPSVSAPGLPDIATSTLTPLGAPVIYYNPGYVAAAGPVVGRFFYLHECAHHALGQVLALASGRLAPIPFAAEQAADCAAIVYLVRTGEFGRRELAIVQASFTGNPGNWTHLPGPVRATNLTACLQNAGTPIPDGYSNNGDSNNGASDNGSADTGMSDGSRSAQAGFAIKLRMWSRAAGNPAEMDVTVDGDDKGQISNLGNDLTLDLGSLTAGQHAFDLTDIVGYAMNRMGQMVPAIQGSCSGTFAVTRSRTLQLAVRVTPAGQIVCAIR